MKYILHVFKSKLNFNKIKYSSFKLILCIFIVTLLTSVTTYIDSFTSSSFAQESRFKRDRNKDRDRNSSRSTFYNDEDTKEENEDTPKNDSVLDDGWSDLKKFSDSQKKQTCKKYEGKYISYYDHVFLVKKCKRQLQDNPELSSKHLIPVDSDVIAQIPPDLPNMNPSKKLNCRDLNNKYVTERYVHVYYVENCTLYEFKDWISYKIHSRSKGKANERLIEIDRNLYPGLKMGGEFESAVLKEKTIIQRTTKESLDIIPIDKACRGLNGKYVSYVDKIYKIENCKKREINPDTFTQHHSNVVLKELTSNQWLSLPDGKPIK